MCLRWFSNSEALLQRRNTKNSEGLDEAGFPFSAAALLRNPYFDNLNWADWPVALDNSPALEMPFKPHFRSAKIEDLRFLTSNVQETQNAAKLSTHSQRSASDFCRYEGVSEMRSQQKLVVMLLVVLAIALSAVAGLLTQAQNETIRKKQAVFDDTQYPIVYESAPEPADPHERAKRQAKGQKFHKAVRVTPIQNFKIRATVYHWPPDFPSLPVAESSAMIVGEVIDAHAYLSTDKTAVYSEFTVNVSQVLKDSNGSVIQNSSVIVTRYGGRVQFPDGRIQLLFNTDQGMPRLGRRYVLFLKRDDQDFDLLTGYELRAGRVFPLDTGTPNFSAHENVRESDFLKQIQQ